MGSAGLMALREIHAESSSAADCPLSVSLGFDAPYRPHHITAPLSSFINPIPVYTGNRPYYNNNIRNHNNYNLIRPTILKDSVSSSPSVPIVPVILCLLNVRALKNKSFICQDLILSKNIDIFMITESWLGPGATASLTEASPPGFSFFNIPRLSGRGGGLAVIYRDNLKCSLVDFGSFSTFEILSFVLNGKCPVLFVIIYRPPNQSTGFLEEFSDLLSVIMARYDRITLAGDFNVHICCPSTSVLATDFITLYESFNLVQSVSGATHSRGHTLDLVLSTGVPIKNLEISEFPVSDHKAVLFQTSLPSPAYKPCSSSRSRSFNANSSPRFTQAFLAVPPKTPAHTELSVDQLIDNFNNTCSEILDSIAPFKTKNTKPNALHWLNDHTREIKKQCRKAERKWKKDRLTSSHLCLRNLMSSYQTAVKNARSAYFSKIITSHPNNPRVLFQTIEAAINPTPSAPLDASPELCEKFLLHFVDKIVGIRQQLSAIVREPSESPVLSSYLNNFNLISLETLEKTIFCMKTSSCQLDVIPTRFMKEVFPTIGPNLLLIVNRSLSSGLFPSGLKSALIQPLLKKPSLDTSVPSNFRPISKLSFLSKILEKIVSVQLISFMQSNSAFEEFQSGFRAGHSTETALLKVTNDLLLSADSGNSSILMLLDLSSAFDTVDHSILIHRLENWVGIKGTALDWFRSYLTDRSFSVVIGDASSSKVPLTCGVPQGSILGPLLFSIYMLPIGNIIRKHNIKFHSYADDTQLYIPLKPGTTGNVNSLLSCLSDIKSWMAQNFLQLNETKTEIIIFGPPNTTPTFQSELNTLSANVTHSARNLGVIFDSDLSFGPQITRVVQTCYFQLRNIARIKSFLSTADLEKVIHAFISSRLDFCNSIYSGLCKKSISRLQLVQNSAARLLTNTKKCEHITPILASLHWLPISFRIDFKILLTTFKARQGLAPGYITALLSPVEPGSGRCLRSSGQALLKGHPSRLVTRGDRAFAVRAPKLWNSLPLELRLATSVSSFKSLLKTYLFVKAFS